MFDVRLEPIKGMKCLLNAGMTKTALADALTGGQRGRLSQWFLGTVDIGPAKRQAIAEYLLEQIPRTFGAPALSWAIPEEVILNELRLWARQGGQKKDVEKPELQDKIRVQIEEARQFFRSAVRVPGIFRTCAFDIAETPGENAEDSVRRALMNVIGMVILREYAFHFPRSRNPDAVNLARLALHRAQTAAHLVRHALLHQDKGIAQRRRRELQVIEIYLRLNRVAVVSLFRKSIANKRDGVFAFEDHEVAAEARASGKDLDLVELLALYRKGHPDRLTIAANALVFASLEQTLKRAVQAWEIAIDEHGEKARDLTEQLPTHERPLAESPDLVWLIAENGGETKLEPGCDIYRKLGLVAKSIVQSTEGK